MLQVSRAPKTDKGESSFSREYRPINHAGKKIEGKIAQAYEL